MPKPEDIYTVIGVITFSVFTDKYLRFRVKRPDSIVSSFTVTYPMNLTLAFITNAVRLEFDIKAFQVVIPYYIGAMIE